MSKKQLSLRKIGIVGGMGPAASVYFERLLVEQASVRGDQDHPTVIHYNNPSIPDRTAFLLGYGNDPVPEIVRTAKQLEKLGVDCLCMPCNTAHAPEMLARITAKIKTPVLDMVQLTISELDKQYPDGATVAVLGTTGTVQAQSFQRAAVGTVLTIVTPESDSQERLMQLIYSIKARGVAAGDAKVLREIMDVVPADCYVIACTELSLLSSDIGNASIIDSLEVLANAALEHTPPEKDMVNDWLVFARKHRQTARKLAQKLAR